MNQTTGLLLSSSGTQEKENIDELPASNMNNQIPETRNPGEQLAGENRIEGFNKGERPVNEGNTTSVPSKNDAEVARSLPEGEIVNEHPNEINIMGQSLVKDGTVKKSLEAESAIGRYPMRDKKAGTSPVTDDTVAKSIFKDDKSDIFPSRSDMVDKCSIMSVKTVAKSCSV